MRALVASQEFKGSLSAAEACEAIAAGLKAAAPDWQVDLVPLSDGGPGFIDALRRAIRCDIGAVAVHDALGRPVLARYLVTGGAGDVIIEAAQANGLVHIEPGERDALRADTRGVGELIAAAVTPGTRRLIVGVGGSATSDGGAGMAMALGARLLDRAGHSIGDGVQPLLSLDRIEWERGRFSGLDVVVAADVRNPLVGPDGAAAVYGPQKGAGPAQVRVIDRALRVYAKVVARDLGVEIAAMPGTGAAGGLAGGLVAFFGATIVSGFDVVASATGLRERLAAADVVITGEGRFDAQSLQGKGPARLRALALEEGREACIFAGQATAREPGVFVLSDLEPDPAKSMAQASSLLRETARRWATARGAATD